MSVRISNVLRVEDIDGLVYFLGTIRANQIKELTFVPVVAASGAPDDPLAMNERPSQGYQRAGDPKRMEKIKQFLLEHPSAVIPPVLLCARGKWTFEPGPSSACGVIVAEDLAAIIDGQHRLGGLWRLSSDAHASSELKSRTIPFMLIDDLPIEIEKFNFVSINDNQQGVKKSLLRFLGKDTSFIGQAAFALMEAEDSVFRGRISIQKKEDSSLVLFGAIQECVAETYSRDFERLTTFRVAASDQSKAQAIEFLLQYWKIVAECMPTFWSDIEKLPPVGATKSKEFPGTRAFEYRLLEETGIRAMSRIGADIFARCWIPNMGSPAWDQVRVLLSKLEASEKIAKILTKPSKDPSVLQIDPDLKSTGKAGVQALYQHLRHELSI